MSGEAVQNEVFDKVNESNVGWDAIFARAKALEGFLSFSLVCNPRKWRCLKHANDFL